MVDAGFGVQQPEIGAAGAAMQLGQLALAELRPAPGCLDRGLEQLRGLVPRVMRQRSLCR
jgi:hypothetical protein